MAARVVLALMVAALLVLVPAASAEPVPEARFAVTTPAGAHPAFSDFDVDQSGFVYVLWPGLVQKYSPAGALVASWGGFGSGPGQFHAPDFNLSTLGLAVDSSGHVFVTDFPGNRVVEFTADGAFVANIGGFDHPWDVAVDASGNLLVTDSSHLTKLAPDGTVLAQRPGGSGEARIGPGNRVFLYSWAIGDSIAWADGADLGQAGQFPLLFGDLVGEKGVRDPSCCGVAYLNGRLWVARSMIGDIEAYGPNGGFVAACPSPDYVYDMIAGRDGRLYVSDGTGVIRYVDTGAACDTVPPSVRSISVSRRVLRISSYRRLRNASMLISATKQSEATVTFTRLAYGRRVKGHCVRPTRRNRRRPTCLRRRVVESSYERIPVPLTDGAYVRFVDLFWKDRPPVGRYQLSVVVEDRNGMKSAARTTRVRLTR